MPAPARRCRALVPVSAARRACAALPHLAHVGTDPRAARRQPRPALTAFLPARGRPAANSGAVAVTHARRRDCFSQQAAGGPTPSTRSCVRRAADRSRTATARERGPAASVAVLTAFLGSAPEAALHARPASASDSSTSNVAAPRWSAPAAAPRARRDRSALLAGHRAALTAFLPARPDARAAEASRSP
jgi:hypothetical protein